MTRTLALCADDFALSPGISNGIAQLARHGRLTAISCLTNGDGWPIDAPLLGDLPPTVDIGLHLNFTEGRPTSARLRRLWPRLPALPRLIALAHVGALPMPEVRAEVHAQLSEFVKVRGRPPDFIDGHQHVHHLPGLRRVILDMVEHVQPLPAIRNTGRLLGPGFKTKRWLIERTGGRALMRELGHRVLAHNTALLGAYDFADTDYRALMRGWLAALPAQGGLLFCHPGARGAVEPPDPIAHARQRELAYLEGDEFALDLKAAGVVLGRAWDAPRPRPG